MDVGAPCTGSEIGEIYARNVGAVYRLCFTFMKNPSDTEDMVQETFVRLMQSGVRFESPRSERAWLIVTASNCCKSLLRRWWRRNADIGEYDPPAPGDFGERQAVTDALLRLPEDYKTAVYMYYYEGWRTPEIARILRVPEATVRSRLSRARKLLKKELGGDPDV